MNRQPHTLVRSRTCGTMAAACVVIALTGAAEAQIQHEAFGSHLAGAHLTITWVTAAGRFEADPVVIQSVGQTGFATLPVPAAAQVGGAARFFVTGETWNAEWNLHNVSDGAAIVKAVFNLADARGNPLSLSIFDDGSVPSTPNSFAGRGSIVAGVSTAPVPIVTDDDFFDPIPGTGGLKNSGDMHFTQIFDWDRNPFLAGQVFIWRDDTDIIPAPGSLALLALGGLVALRRRR